jgi:Flavodoxin
MKRILITYSTTDGQTKLICEKIKSILENTFEIDLRSIKSINQDLEVLNKNFIYVIVGASIRYGKHSNDLYDFIKNNIDFLKSSNNAFFSVNVVARKAEKNTPEKNPYIEKFLTLSNWTPKKY